MAGLNTKLMQCLWLYITLRCFCKKNRPRLSYIIVQVAECPKSYEVGSHRKLILLSFVPQMSPIYCRHLPIFLPLQALHPINPTIFGGNRRQRMGTSLNFSTKYQVSQYYSTEQFFTFAASELYYSTTMPYFLHSSCAACQFQITSNHCGNRATTVYRPLRMQFEKSS